MQRIDAGDKVRFFEDFYGKQWVEVKRGWMFFRKKRIYLRNDQIAEIKTALVRRRRQRNAPAQTAVQ